MNFSRLLILILISFNLFGQIEFKSDSIRNIHYAEIITEPNYDTIEFVLRFWKEVERVPGTFLELAYTKSNEWKYRIGYINFGSRKLIIKTNEKGRANLDSVWTELSRLEILNIKNQIESVWTRTNDAGQNFRVRTDKLTYDRRGNFYSLELIKKLTYRQINYVDPEGLLKMFEQIHTTSIDHERIINIANLLNRTFDLDIIMRQQLIERFQKKTLKGNKKKN
jgi:hypothetical protein